ncbi:PQQ-binding-like beta-propeller repeat protein [Thalassotalea fonticola]|uniref:PQQ-binding-like beta-propeller repeat protein n=1 Tax=Thalassotalea fonticola TaxID=3065649 RepID=A0ABZ0GI83_9GAMM|nr:PQQ-binding-like beta-propeller repeat protein [Colwelliaceae bacterium S1-1]
MKLKVSNIATLITVTLLGACQESSNALLSTAQEKPKFIDSAKQWPMFSGPNGTGHISGEFIAPINWSVRQDQNILWKTELPAGGQSGIAVWGDDVFFTINKPLDTPKHAQLVANNEAAEITYKSQYQEVTNAIKADKSLLTLLAKLAAAEEMWSAAIERLKSKNSDNVKQQRAIKKLKRDSPLWQSVAAAEKSRDDFIHQQSPALLTAYKQYQTSQKQLKAKGLGKDIILYCLSASTGTVKWQRTISGVIDTMYNYSFSDATSPTPITDGQQVWVVNATGGMASFSMTGQQLWSRNWQPTTGRPFNKQYDTLLSGDLLFNVEPPVKGDTSRNQQWNYIHAINKYTGETSWVSNEALTHYNTPMLGKTKSGESAVLIGRGGPHGVPEKAEGLSLLDLNGNAIWSWQAEDDGLVPWGATDIQIWNKDKALWIAGKQDLMLYTIDAETGKKQSKYDLSNVARYVYDQQNQSHRLQPAKQTSFERQPYTIVMVNDAVYYMVRYEPYIGYLNLTTGQHLQLEVPTEVSRISGQEDQFIWQKAHKNDQLNSKGQRHNIESRAQGDGTQKAFLASPIVVNNKVYFTNAHGLTYVIDSAVDFNENALTAVNDLGQTGKTYSLSSMAHANGVLFQRSLKAIYAIKAP